MSVDFFSAKYQRESPRTDTDFGIIDSQPAKTSTDENIEWVAVVHNTTGKALQFVPIDHNIPLFNRNGGISKRCDGMLFFCNTDEILCFIELKTGEDAGHTHWLKVALGQLQQTILHFQKEHPSKAYALQVAYASHGKRDPARPEMPLFINTSKQMFEDKTGYFLRITNSIPFPYVEEKQ